MKQVMLALLLSAGTVGAQEPATVDLPADELEDRIRGGLLGQIFGNLNGLPHEFKYIEEPGKVETYTPSLPDGARTDDDTDIEWVYVAEMAASGRTFVPPARLAELWKANITKGIWCANLYARNLMDLGLEPPATGRICLNPWSVFNISAQFVSEAFGLVAPGMPRTASKIGVHYTHVAVDGEPIQSTQFFTAMIALAFVEKDVVRIVDAGATALDPRSELRAVVADVRGWWREHPGDWRQTRRLIKEKYTRHGGGMRDRNGYELNSAAIVAALLYGGDDFTEGLRLAFNMGWDSDCNAATVGTILGVLKGRRWMDAQGWVVKDVYRNTCRDAMPKDETITGYGEKLVRVARSVILENGGREVEIGGKKAWRIPREAPANVEPLPAGLDRAAEVRAEWLPRIEKDLDGSPRDRARAAYLALALGESERIRKERPEPWKAAVEELKKFPILVGQIYDAPGPQAGRIKAAAKAEGLVKPEKPPK